MNIQNTLALIITLGFFAVIGVWMYFPPTGSPEALAVLNTLTGMVGTAFAGVVGYFFGSSTGSKAKDDVLNKIASDARPEPLPPGSTVHVPPAAP